MRGKMDRKFMYRAIPVPLDVPDGYEAIFIIFAQSDENKGNTSTLMHASEPLLVALRGMDMAKRMKTIKRFLVGIERMLLQYSSSSPEEKTGCN